MSNRSRQTQTARVARERAEVQRRSRRNGWIMIAALLLIVAGGIVGWRIYLSQQPDEYAAPTGVTNDGGDRAGLSVAGNGPVAVEVYLDFLCPECGVLQAATSDTLNQLAASGKIRLVWHPLGFRDQATSPPGYSTRAANAAGCAADAGKLQAYGETLFANQPAEGSAGLTDDQLIDLGGPVGLNAPSFAQCVRGRTYVEWVTHGNAAASERGVSTTPAAYVNGAPIEAPTLENLIAAINAVG